MILAELEVFHSRPIAPTRRVALGRQVLPTEPRPGFGGILLGGVVARNIGGLAGDDEVEDLHRLMGQLEKGQRIAQPRLRYRFQVDRVGLQRSTHRLHAEGETLWFEFDDGNGEPCQQLLGAVYAAGALPSPHRGAVMGALRRAAGWTGAVGPELIATLSGFGRAGAGQSLSHLALADPVAWALQVMGFDEAPDRTTIQRRFREALRSAHPDHGGASEQAARRIAELTQARRILLGA